MAALLLSRMSLKQQACVLHCQHKPYKTEVYNNMLYYNYEIYCKVELQFQFRKLWDRNFYSQ